MKRSDVVNAARRYIGTRWVHEGRSSGGVDCIGLVCAVATDLGIAYADKKGYDRTPTGTDFLNHLLKYLTVNRSGLLLPGSVAVIRQSRFPCHVGIFSSMEDQKTLIHAYVPRHRVVEERWIPSTDFGLVMVLDFPGVSD